MPARAGRGGHPARSDVPGGITGRRAPPGPGTGRPSPRSPAPPPALPPPPSTLSPRHFRAPLLPPGALPCSRTPADASAPALVAARPSLAFAAVPQDTGLGTLRSRRTKSQKSSRCGRRAAAPGLAAQSISALNPRTGICFSDYGVQARGALGSEGQGAQGAAAGPPPAPALAAPPSCRAPGWPRPAGWSSAMCTSPSSRGGARTAVPPGAGGGARLGPAVPGEPPRGGSQGAGWWPHGHLAGTLRPARLPQWLLGSLM